MSNDPYFAFILAAYLVAFTVLTGTIVATPCRLSPFKRALERFSTASAVRSFLDI